jgi:hypothetical protein
MNACVHARRSGVPTAAGVATMLAGAGFTAMGLWARRDVRLALEQERVGSDLVGSPGLVTTATGARATAELIRRNTLKATGGRTYSETAAYLDDDGSPSADAALAAKDDRGQPVENPDHQLWIQSTALQSALLQAYMAFRLSELTLALGASFVAVGAGLAAAGRAAGGPQRRGR